MSRDPIDRNMLRMELRRFQTRCEAQEGTIRRADTLRAVARLGKMAIPFPLSEETAAMDARAQVRKTAEERSRELIEDMLRRLEKSEPQMRDKLHRQFEDEVLNLTGFLIPLRNWAESRWNLVMQSFRQAAQK